jgi:hypothetical protein
MSTWYTYIHRSTQNILDWHHKINGGSSPKNFGYAYFPGIYNTQLLIHTFNLSINCTVTGALYTLNWKPLKKISFIYNFVSSIVSVSPYYSTALKSWLHSRVIFPTNAKLMWLQMFFEVHYERMQIPHIYQVPVLVLHFDYTTVWNGKVLFYSVFTIYCIHHMFHALIHSLWIYCEWNQQTVFY